MANASWIEIYFQLELVIHNKKTSLYSEVFLCLKSLFLYHTKIKFIMYDIVLVLHSYWAFLVLLVLFLATINALIKFFGKREFHAKDFRISLFTLIVSHIQLLIGLLLYVVSPRLQMWSESGMGGIMKDSVNRLYLVEHPLINIIAVALITIGYSKHKKKLTSTPKFKILAMFYTIALVLFLSRIPWNTWMN